MRKCVTEFFHDKWGINADVLVKIIKIFQRQINNSGQTGQR